MLQDPLNAFQVRDNDGTLFFLSAQAMPYRALSFSTISDARDFLGCLSISRAMLQQLDSSVCAPATITVQRQPGAFRQRLTPLIQRQRSDSQLFSGLERYQLTDKLAEKLSKRLIYSYSQQQIALEQQLQTSRIAPPTQYTIDIAYKNQHRPISAMTFSSLKQAENFIATLNQPLQYWQALLPDQTTNNPRQTVARKLLEGEICVHEKVTVRPLAPVAAPAVPKRRHKSAPVRQPVTTDVAFSHAAIQVSALKAAAVAGSPLCRDCG